MPPFFVGTSTGNVYVRQFNTYTIYIRSLVLFIRNLYYSHQLGIGPLGRYYIEKECASNGIVVELVYRIILLRE